MRQLALDIAEAPAPTLDNFVAGGNGELLQQLRRLTLERGAERMIYVWGDAGCGRTHLLKGFVAAVADSGAFAAYVACSAAAQFSGNLGDAACVAADDVDRLDERGQIALFGLYNRLRERGGALLASGSVPPADLRLRPDLVTRLGWGLVYQVRALTDAEKTDALLRYGGLRGLELSNEVCEFLLRRLRRDMPSLLAMLDALDRYSLETKRQITVPLVREYLEAARQVRNQGQEQED